MQVTKILAFCLLGVVHLDIFALGLGEIHVKSALNEPLAATIDLSGASGVTEEELLVQLGSDADFKQMGISRESVLLQLKFEPKLKGDNPVISVTSDRPIREPVLNFILNLQSPKAQMMKEYTIFLNPAK
jgi:pilus assembly protein FimV